MKTKHHTYRRRKVSFHFTLSFLGLLFMAVCAQAQVQIGVTPPPEPIATPVPVCERTVKADVVALDQVIMYNRLGTVNPGGMIYALKQDVVAIDPLKGIVAGNVRLRSTKRPRPRVGGPAKGELHRIRLTKKLYPPPKNKKHE